MNFCRGITPLFVLQLSPEMLERLSIASFADLSQIRPRVLLFVGNLRVTIPKSRILRAVRNSAFRMHGPSVDSSLIQAIFLWFYLN
jgi:hypothetical protein